MLLIISLPLEGLRGYGDLEHFYNLSALGVPFIDLWVEFPPIFPILSRMLYLFTSLRQHAYDYLLVISLTFAQAVCIYIFTSLAERVDPGEEGYQRAVLYMVISLVLPYTWWYFDALAVMFMLMGLHYAFEKKTIQSSLSIALGVLIKVFPGFILPAILRSVSWRERFRMLAPMGLLISLVYGFLFAFSPGFTLASLRSQAAKGSWETVWALIDQNFSTGNFGPEWERYQPELALRVRGNPARIPALRLLPVFLVFGIWLWYQSKLRSIQRITAFSGLTCIIFFIWSPGYSPQWVLYLLPLLLLAMPMRLAIQFASAHLLINLLEWPVLLTRGYNWGLWITIPLRMMIWIMIGFEFFRQIRQSQEIDT
jgi:hypothetical protein